MTATVERAAESAAAIPQETPFRRFVALYEPHRARRAGRPVLAIAVVAVFAPWISPQDPYDLAKIDIVDARLPPGEKSADGMTFVLGSDDQGRDMLSAIFYGLRISLGVGIAPAMLACGLASGSPLGLIAASYAGGPSTESTIMRVVDLQLSFPAILIALVLLAVLGQGVDKIIIALITVQWAYYARTVRSSALVEFRNKEYVEAARCFLRLSAAPASCSGTSCRIACRRSSSSQRCRWRTRSRWRSRCLVSRPRTAHHQALARPADLERLLLSPERQVLDQFFIPALALLITIMSINLVADQLRDVLNPRL